MPEYLTPGVYYERTDAAPPLMAGRTDVAGFVGLAERGPVGVAVRVDSWMQFQARFGSFVPWAFLAYAVKGFFENGGRTCLVVRVAGDTRASAAIELVDGSSPTVPVMRIEALDPGTWASKLAISIVGVNPAAKTFSFYVLYDRQIVESFTGLSIRDDDPQHPFFETAINTGVGRSPPSRWVRATKLNSASDALPDAVASGMIGGTICLSGGNDGLSSLKATDFIGDVDHKSGLAVLEELDTMAILAVPDIHVRAEAIRPPVLPPKSPPMDPCCPLDRAATTPALPPPPVVATDVPPMFGDDDVRRVQQAMIEQCERQKDRVAVLSVPLVEGSVFPRDPQTAIDWRNGLFCDRGFAGLYYPWVKVIDPVAVTSTRWVPPCGHVCGVYARTDLARGVHKAPANEELLWAEDVHVSVSENTQGILNPRGVNALRAFPGRGIRCYGGRTIHADPDWRFVNVRRLMCMIETTLRHAMNWVVFEPNDWPVRVTVAAQISTFLQALWGRGALAGRSAEEAFFVRCDETNNTQIDRDNGRMIVDIGVAPTVPAEFVVFRIGRTAEELEIVEG